MQTQEQIVDNELDDLSFLDALDAIIAEEENEQVIDEALLEAAIDGVVKEEEITAIYDEQAELAVVPEKIAVGAEEPAVIEELAEEEEPVAAAAPVIAKTPTPKVETTRSAKIISRLGAEVDDYTLLTPDWASLSEEERLKKFGAIIDSMAQYVGDKAVNLFAFLKTGGGLNVVTARAFEVFLRDGMLTGGDEGNIIKNLLTKPYSIGTARSQGNQMLQLFTALEIGKRGGRGIVTVNEESVLLERIKTALGK